MNQKGISSIVIILIIIGILVVVGGVWYWQGQKEKPVVCTQDTKLCPDGSSIGRTGPNCEFAACPKPKLTSDILKNAEYYSQDTGTRIKMVNGTYPLKPLAGESQADYFVKLDTDHVVFGDLNDDGQEDAVVILVSRAGGTGTYRQLAVVLNQNGNANNIANQNLGDRTAINSLTISSGVISVDMTPWDGGTGARKTVNYKLSGNKLVEF